ncbi:helix-turn-helix domain-containing protein [Ruminococcus sp. Marseille-P6503]|uniref:MerR family transcriptional regulator n=1 Tax=Ruminococcus sp. Marseille-P6503 TaxID=2364796 RepID=UPI000F5269BC|nr:helix-turn-helix domain-containing protein [Ruminococcus sp. Marseille-P6503]
MKIGEFARICNTKISVLRHYDKEGLLKPEYIDRFTGYRYYSAEQVEVFFRIAALKKAGFSLAQINEFISEKRSSQELIELFRLKRAQLYAALSDLKEAEKTLLGAELMINVIFIETNEGLKAKSEKVDGSEFNSACEAIEQAVVSQDCQRISEYRSFGEPGTNQIEAVCDVVRLNGTETEPRENTNLPFEDDPLVVGKWETIGEYAVKQDFFADKFCTESPYTEAPKEIYFLPEGKRYWCYGWTKGRLLIDTGESTTVNPYEIEDYNGDRYMFVSHKSYNYRRGGKPTVLVLRQLDNKAYSAEGLAKKDDISMPFADDRRVIGKWKAFDFCRTKEEFSPERKSEQKLHFSELEFLENGSCISRYGDEIISGDNMQVWTKGYVLRKWNSSACAYEIRTVNGTDYLIIEWKSGDYIWGGFDTDYYVFIRSV